MITWDVSHFKVSHNHVHFYSRFGCREALVDDLWFLNPEHSPISINGILLFQIWL